MWNRDSLETRDERRREVYSRKSSAAQVPDARDLQDDFIDAGVAGVPGGYFATPDKQDDPCPYLRLTYASADDDAFIKGAARLAATLKKRRGA